MATLNHLFDIYLAEIEPNSNAVKHAIKAHTSVREHLESDSSFKGYVNDTFLYGSYKRHTAIGDIKDVDIVVVTSFDITDEANAPHKVLRKLKTSLAKFYKDPENPEYQRRSIRVNDPLPDEKNVEMTLDIIPVVPIDDEDGILWVPDREVKQWVKSHPNQHIAYTTKLNSDEHSQGRFVPLVKIMKAWWKYQCSIQIPKTVRPKPKGFWIECLTAENFDPNKGTWAESFIAVLQNISIKYSSYESVPELADPGLPNETIKTNMTIDEFSIFIGILNNSLKTARLAFDDNDEKTSTNLWKSIFGNQFGTTTKYSSGEFQSFVPRDKGEQFLSDIGITENLIYSLKIDAQVTQDGWRQFLLRETSNPLHKKRRLEFFINFCDVPEQYDIKWKVKNLGDEASSARDFRGEITNDKGGKIKIENTKYTGRHYVECYAIQNNVCVAKDRIEVPISNQY